MNRTISIIDYKAGNAPSVLNAFTRLDVPARLVYAGEDVLRADALVLPGVGAAGETMAALRETGVLDALNERVYRGGVPFLGICVGLQILFEHSEEAGGADCLGWLKGAVKRFDADSVRVPQIGWNEVVKRADDPLWRGLGERGYFYFVNSYYAAPTEVGVCAAEADYGGAFCAMVRQDNIAAAQFHAEKSGEAGLRMLRNFAGEAGVC